MEVNHLIETLGLLPHPEGGYYKETYAVPNKVISQDLKEKGIIAPASTF